nr:hypothetical protein [Tanacetum cinerariifolium]GFA22475.1 hypothetical protein [Tanacetum cinerariifolium]
EETNTFHNSLPEFENFYFDLEEISSGSTTTYSDISLSEYDSFVFDPSNDQFPPTDRSDLTYEEFADELAHIISPPDLLHLAGSQPMLKSSYKAEDGVIISIPPLVGGVADVVVEIKGTELLLKPGTTPIVVRRPNMNVAQPKMTSFAKIAHSNVKRSFQRKSTVKNHPRVPRVSTVTKKIPTVDSKFPTAKSTLTADLGDKEKAVKGNPQNNIDDKGYWDSGCSRHMTGNIFYLSEYEPYDGGYVSFGHGGGKITGKGIIKTCKLEFENVYFIKN